MDSSPVPSSFNTLQEEIAYYKAQYEHLESELQEFQASSRELEAELEKDVVASEKRERSLKEKVESLTYEVDEWKTKHRQSKTEANNAQSTLQKEITSLREQSRTQQMRLRDIEVANDDFERQARNTTSSLEDLESKYNQALERTVMLEEEVRSGEQEREGLRIETQRLRDEVSDLKIEADITQDKLRAAENANKRRYKRVSQLSDSKDGELQSPGSEGSVTSASLASTFTTPAAKSESEMATSDAPTPPSPPLSDLSGPKANGDGATVPKRASLAPTDPNKTPKPMQAPTAGKPHAAQAGPRTKSGISTPAPPVFNRNRTGLPTPRYSGVGVHGESGLPRSSSLYQIRGLIGKMQKLEQRVHSARSKLPAPTNTPPRASPRGGSHLSSSSLSASSLSNSAVPSTVTIRSGRKRTSVTSGASSQAQTDESASRRLSHRQSRISFGGGPTGMEAPGSSRPSSRASNTSHSGFVRPSSRLESGSGRPESAADTRRPRSSLSGRMTPSHGHRQSVGGAGYLEEHEFATPTPRRPVDKNAATGIPAPAGLGRRQSAQALGLTPGRRKSVMELNGAGQGGHRRESTNDVGETY